MTMKKNQKKTKDEIITTMRAHSSIFIEQHKRWMKLHEKYAEYIPLEIFNLSLDVIDSAAHDVISKIDEVEKLFEEMKVEFDESSPT
jgi:hypothetical protein